MGAAYGASRVTVRKALEELRAEGVLDARQGFGWFVAEAPVRQGLGRLGTIEEQLAASGLRAERRVLEFAFVKASRRARAVLGVETVLRVRRVNLADGRPFALVTVWCPEALGAPLSRAEVERASFYELLPVEFGGAVQSIGAAVASESQAGLLDVPVGAPVLRCERVTSDTEGRPVLLAEHIFPAHRTEFVVELPAAEPSLAPQGLRLLHHPPRTG